MPLDHSPLAHHFRDLDQQHEAATLGMWIFLSTELMVFGALFTGYTVYRAAYHAEFAAASALLHIGIAGINTIVLLTSSLTMVLAVHGVRQGRRQLVVRCLIATAVLGTTFLVLKVFEYHGDYRDGLVPGLSFQDQEWLSHDPPLKPGAVKLFLFCYYAMTGLHALHLLIGIGMIAVLTWQTARGRYTPYSFNPVEVGGLYWHFVDVVWLFLLPLLYLVGPRGG